MRPLQRLFLTFMLFLGTGLVVTLPAQAASFNPGCTGTTGDAAQLQADIATATNNGQADTITLVGGCIYTLSAPLIITADNLEPLILNGNGAMITAGTEQVLYVKTFNVTLNDVTIQGVSQIDSEPTLFGGGIYNEGGLTLNNVWVRDHFALAFGGGIFNTGVLTLNSSLVSGNIGLAGGGIANLGGVVTLNNSIVSSNHAPGGGGIWNVKYGTVNLNNSLIYFNSAHTGSGVFNAGEFFDPGIEAVIGIISWTGDLSGGTITMNNSTITSNQVNVTSPDPSGDFFMQETGVATLYNSVIAATIDGVDCVNLGGSLTAYYSVVQDATCGFSGTAAAPDANGNFSGDPRLDPVFPLDGSPVIDRGSPDNPLGTAPACLTNDHNGNPRPVDGDGDGVARCDIGAIEAPESLFGQVLLSALDTTGAEQGSDTGTLRFTRMGSTEEDLPVSYTLGGTAGASDYTPTLTGTLTIPSGSAFVDLTITPVDDTIAENSETVILTLTEGAEYNLGANTTAEVMITDNDTAGITVNTASLSAVTEDSTTVTTSFTIAANTTPTANVTITFTPDAQCDAGNGGGEPVTVTLPADSTAPQTVTVSAANDTTAEAASHPCVITITTSSTDNFYSALAVSDVNVTVLDNDVEFTVTTSSSPLDEGTGTNTTVTFTVAPSAAIANVGGSVTYAVTDTNAETTDDDFTAPLPSGTFSFAQGSGAQQVAVTIVGDAIDETFIALEFSASMVTAGTNGTGSTTGAPASVMVNDDDDADVTVEQSDGSTDVTEGGATDIVTVVLTSQPTESVIINLIPDSQLLLDTTLLTFTPLNWDSAQTVTVTAVDDHVVEGAHTALVTLSVSGDPVYVGLDLTSHAITANIIDNDTAGITVNLAGMTSVPEDDNSTTSFTIAANTVPTADVTITLTTDGQCSVSPTTVTLPMSSIAAQTVMVSAVNDTTAEAALHTCAITTSASASSDSAYYNLSVNDVNVTALDNDIPFIVTTSTTPVDEGTGTNTTVTFTVAPGAAVANVGGSVIYTLTDTSGTTTDADFTVPLIGGTLTFPQGSGSQQVTVTVIGDLIDEPNFTLELASSAITSGMNGTASISGAPASVTVNDDDFPGFEVGTLPGSITEGSSGSYNLRLTTQPTGDVVLNLSASTSDQCTVNSPVALNPDNWNTATNNVTVSITQDQVTEIPHSDCVITYALDTGATTDSTYDAVTPPANSSLNVTDDDTPGVTVNPVTPPNLVTTESDVWASFTVVLNTQPTADVVLSITSSNTNEGTVSAAALTFTPDNWDQPQTVTVSVVDDSAVDGDVDYAVTFAVVSGDGVYAPGMTLPTVSITNQDNDVPGIILTPRSFSVGEGFTGSYQVGLATNPSGGSVEVTVTFDNTQLEVRSGGTSFILTFTDTTPQTIPFTVIGNSTLNSSRVVSITHQVSASTSDEYTTALSQVLNINIDEIVLVPPPPSPTCDSENENSNAVVRAGIPDALAFALNCRVLYFNGGATTWLGSPLYSEANLGVAGVLELGVQQAIDIFSPPPSNLTYFEGGAVFCLRGEGTLIWLAASGMPRHAEIIGSYPVPEFPGFTCVTLFEPGTLILVRENPLGS